MESQLKSAEQEVMAVLEAWSAALYHKDLDALAKCYAKGVQVFDIGAQAVGYDKLRGLWESCFPYFPNPIGTQRKDVQATVGDDVAVVAFYSRLTGMESDHASAKSWIRSTVCLKKMDGQWKIFHEHASFPVDCGAEKPTYLFDDLVPPSTEN